MSRLDLRNDLLGKLLSESQAYQSFADIEKLVESDSDLSMIPIQPLFVSLQTTSNDQVAQILPRLSSQQRQALRDIDLWNKDLVDPKAVHRWLDIYSKCSDENVVLEFIQSEDFLLGLKNQFLIQTFDVEDPLYPEGDHYFLTEDNLLLIEYPEDFSQVQELKNMVRLLYSHLGVENAYAFLFKMLVDSYQIMEEEAFQEKKERLRDFGFIDYFEALAFNSAFSHINQVDSFIKSKKTATASIDASLANQNLHSSSLLPYQSGMEGLREALEKVQDEKRRQFLAFNFISLAQAKITLDDALKSGRLAMMKVGNQTKQFLELGFDYVSHHLLADTPQGVFDLFDFVDLHKVGLSLIQITKKKIKKALASSPFDNDEKSYFLGMHWNTFLENSLSEVTSFKGDDDSKPAEIRDLKSFEHWEKAQDTFSKSLPYIQRFLESFEGLRSQNLLNDQFYLNYEVENIDFEAIMISSLINDTQGVYERSSQGKMGVTVKELKDFYNKFFAKDGDDYFLIGPEDKKLAEQIESFTTKFGLLPVPGFDHYLYQIMKEQLNGYPVDKMEEEEFKHVGGPILLNNLAH